jgi:diaminohydroxyphosphoribosylaminopyrimidine deaminase/5-amino-6-(5-phosphoribosylamino)uracil reductase
VRVVLDRRLRLAPASKLASSARTVPTWLFTGADAPERGRKALRALGVDILLAGTDASGQLDLREVLAALAARGITRVLVEGGAALAASLLRQRLVDRLAWFRGPVLIGGDGHAAIGALGVDAIIDALTVEPAGSALLAQGGPERYIIEAG